MFIDKVLIVVMYFLIFYWCLSVFGVNMIGFFVVGGVLGIVVGFAA